MNRIEILGQVYDAIWERPANTGHWWYLCWFDGKIQCLPMSYQPKPEIIFWQCTTWSLIDGFTTVIWGEIEARIYTFLKEKGLC